MKKLIILDYSTGMVHIYDYNGNKDVNDEYIDSLGYHANDCCYMIGDLEIIQHKGILK